MYQSRFRIDGKTAVVTGGGQSIGLACAEALGEAGARVVIIERTDAIGAAGRDALAAKGIEAEVLVGDVTNSARITEIADDLAARGTPATILINNAGIGESGTAAEDVPDDALAADDGRERQRPLLVLARLRPPHARRSAAAPSSTSARCRAPSPTGRSRRRPTTSPRPPCTTSPAASPPNGPPRGVRVNAVAPTYIETPMVTANPLNRARLEAWLHDTPMARMGKADEVASAVLFLASDAASLMTGAIVPVDGGYICW